LRVLAANKNALIEDLLVNRRTWPGSPIAVPPIARRVTAKPIIPVDTSHSNSAYVHEEFLVDVSYETSEGPDNEDLLSESLEPEAEFLKLPNTGFRWKTAQPSDIVPLNEGEAPGLLQPRLRLVRQMFLRNTVPSQMLLAGHVHNGSHFSQTFGLTFAAETLMLIPQPIGITRGTLNTGKYNYGATFVYKPTGWNKFLRLDTMTHEEILQPNGLVYKPYTPADLSVLLS
jgi:hypothetical protein